MSRGKWWIAAIALVIIILVAGGIFFVKTGGVGLYRVTWNYFLRDLPDKKYSWQDFTERGIDQGISGFYAYGSPDGFSMWTLSGLKTFRHVPGTSIYQHEDVCRAMMALKDNPQANGGTMKANQDIVWELPSWQGLIKPENLVSVVRLKDPGPKNRIDKVWSYSGKYKELNKLDQESCN